MLRCNILCGLYVNENNINIRTVGINQRETNLLHCSICKCHSRKTISCDIICWTRHTLWSQAIFITSDIIYLAPKFYFCGQVLTLCESSFLYHRVTFITLRLCSRMCSQSVHFNIDFRFCRGDSPTRKVPRAVGQ